MACTAVSTEPWPVITATSVRGSSFFTFSRNSIPDMLGITMSVSTMWAGCSSSRARAVSPLLASRQIKPRASPTVMQSLRMLCSSSTISSRTRRSSLPRGGLFKAHSPCFPHGFLDSGDQILHAEGFFQIKRPDLAQGGDGFFVGIVARNDDDFVDEIRAIGGNPGVDLGAVDAAGRAHVRDHAEELAFFQQTQGFGAALDADDLIAVALERGADQGHDGGLVFDEQNR